MTALPKTRWATTDDGASIAYQVLGQGDHTIVVIHPWASHLEVYWEQPRFARFMRRLARDLRVVHMDKRGWGMSDRIFGTPDVSLLMDDVRAVMDASGTDRAAVFGWGGTGGAPLAALFAATYPERTSALLLDGRLHERWSEDHPVGVTDEEEDEWVAAFAPVWGDDDHAVECAKWCYGDRAEDCPIDDQTFLRWWTKMMRYSSTPTSMVAFSRMWHVTDIRPALPTIHVPTAVMCKKGAPEIAQSEEDQRDWAEFNVRHIPGARLVEVPGAAHVIWIEDPEPYVSALEAFLRSVRDEQAEFDRMLATVLFTDIVGSTGKACELGDRAWTQLLERHDQVMRAMLARYRGAESTRPATASSPPSTGRRGRCAAPRRSARRWSLWASRSEPAATPARSNSWAPMWAASPCTSAPASLPSPGPPRSSSAPPSRTSSPAPASSSRTVGNTRSRACRRGGGCTPWRPRPTEAQETDDHHSTTDPLREDGRRSVHRLPGHRPGGRSLWSSSTACTPTSRSTGSGLSSPGSPGDWRPASGCCT